MIKKKKGLDRYFPNIVELRDGNNYHFLTEVTAQLDDEPSIFRRTVEIREGINLNDTRKLLIKDAENYIKNIHHETAVKKDETNFPVPYNPTLPEGYTIRDFLEALSVVWLEGGVVQTVPDYEIRKALQKLKNKDGEISKETN